MKVIIAGTRTINNYAIVKKAIESASFEITEIVHGDCRGVDRLGKQWAKENGIKQIPFPTKWELYGNRAGSMRNEEMGQYADALIAIWDGKSRGTGHMIWYMKEVVKKPVKIFSSKIKLKKNK